MTKVGSSSCVVVGVVLALAGCRTVIEADEVGNDSVASASESMTGDSGDSSDSGESSTTATTTTTSDTTTADTTSTDTTTADTSTDTTTADTTSTDTTSTDTTSTDTTGSTDTGSESTDTGSESTGDPIDCMGPDVPTDAALLQIWLEQGNYSQWAAESAPHASSGPHFGEVKTFVHPCLADSLDANQNPHPAGSAAVKELYGAGDVVLGWSVMVKIAEGGDDLTWYWYERFEGVTTTDAIGDPICSDCHAEGSDKFTSFWPLL